MKALIMDEERHLIVKDMPKPQEKDENIIIKVEAASICGTDMRTFLKGKQSAFNMKVCLLHMLRFPNRQLSWKM